MAPEAAIGGLLGGDADKVKIAAVANSLRSSVFWNLRRLTRGGRAPHVTICSLFLRFKT